MDQLQTSSRFQRLEPESPEADRRRAAEMERRANARALRHDIREWLLKLSGAAKHNFCGIAFDFCHGEVCMTDGPGPLFLSIEQATERFAQVREAQLAAGGVS